MSRDQIDRKSSLEKTRRFVVKVGTSSLTDLNSKLDIGRVANRVSMLRRERGRTPILVSSGAKGARGDHHLQVLPQGWGTHRRRLCRLGE